jgi:hypothetical protein
MGPSDKNVNTRAYPPNVKGWSSWPIVVRLAWLWGKRNVEAVKRADKKRLMVFRTKEISSKLEEIFEFIGKPMPKRAVKLANTKHNRLQWPPEAVAAAEREIDENMEQIEMIIAPFKRTISRWYGVF